MRRVMIIGQPGAGKSTLARAVGEIAHLPVFHMDHIHWMPVWQPRPEAEKRRLVQEVHALDRWVFEGGHSASWNDRLARADTLIWLDIPVGRRLVRLGRRWARWRGRSRPDLPAGCAERLDPDFLAYVWRTRASGRAKCAATFATARPDQMSVHLDSPRKARGWVHALRYAAQRGNLGISHR